MSYSSTAPGEALNGSCPREPGYSDTLRHVQDSMERCVGNVVRPKAKAAGVNGML